MRDAYFGDWSAIRLYVEGRQGHMARHFNCVPAWDITAIHSQPDGVIPHPDYARSVADPAGDYPDKDTVKYVFWDRHIDKRFHIEYPRVTQDSPRPISHTFGDSDKDW